MKQIRTILALGAALCAPLPAFSQGSIIYVDVPDVLVGPRDGESAFDLNSDGVADASFRRRSGAFQVIPNGGNEVSAVAAAPPDLGGHAIPVAFGSSINTLGQWQQRYPSFFLGQFFGPTLSMESDRGEAFGTFAGVDGYLGIRFYIGANLHYGWIHVNSDLGFPKQAAGFITEWAYNSSPNQPIAAGVVPEPSVAALLIIGGGSVLLFRRFKT